MNSRTVLRQTTENDCEPLLDTLTGAFADDPVWGAWAFPRRDLAQDQRRALFRLWLMGALDHRCVLATAELEAVAVWYPDDATQSSQEDRLALTVMASSLGDQAETFLEGCALLEAAHPQHRSHFYLCLLATRLDARGRGCGERLLEGSLELLDAARMPAYLESTNPRNLQLYERLAFERIGSVALPGNGPKVDLMWREPK
jgi:GNAT superfamily N-acetyltransferase